MPRTRSGEIHKNEVITKYYETIWSNWKDTTTRHFIITKITKNLNNSRTILYKNIESITDIILESIYLDKIEIDLKLKQINEVILNLLLHVKIQNQDLDNLTSINFINQLKEIDLNDIKLTLITQEEMHSIWALIKNKTVEEYIYKSTEFQEITSEMIEWFIPYCTAKLFLLHNVCEWDLNAINFLKKLAQESK